MENQIRICFKNNGSLINLTANIVNISQRSTKLKGKSFEFNSDFFSGKFVLNDSDEIDDGYLKELSNSIKQDPLPSSDIIPVSQPVSNNRFKDSIFNRINQYLKSKNYDSAYEEIKNLEFIKNPLVSHILNSGNKKLISNVYSNDKFKDITNYIEEVISESKSCIPIPFEIWTKDFSNKKWENILIKTIESQHSDYIQSILRLDIDLDYTNILKLCFNNLNVEYLDLILESNVKKNINFNDFKNHPHVDNPFKLKKEFDKILHMYCLLTKGSDNENKKMFKKTIDELIENREGNINLDSIYLYCSITSFDNKNIQKSIFEKLMLYAKQQTIWYEKNSIFRFSKYNIKFCLDQLQDFLFSGNKNKISESYSILSIIDSDDELKVEFPTKKQSNKF